MYEEGQIGENGLNDNGLPSTEDALTGQNEGNNRDYSQFIEG